MFVSGSIAVIFGLFTLLCIEKNSLVFSIICACVFALFLTRFFGEAGKTTNKKRAQRKTMDEIGASVMFEGNHLNGLPFEHGSSCNVIRCADKYRFMTNADFYDLSFDKVTDVVIKSHADIYYYVRRNAKKIRYIYFYYDNNGVHGYITIDCSHDLKAYKFVKDFKARNVNKQGKNYQKMKMK